MNHLEQKSIQNKSSAFLLIEKGYYASSIHCSYYAMLQFMICRYAEKLNKSFETIGKETSAGEGTHNYIVNGLLSHIETDFSNDVLTMKNVNETNLYKLKRKIKDLKNYRVKSDYHNFAISQNESEKFYKLSEEIVNKTKAFLS